MEVSVDSARRGSQFRLDTALTIGLGVVLGIVARNLPIAVATLVYPTEQRRSCDDTAIECAISAAPDVIGGLVMFGLLVLFLAAVFATCGVLLVARGLRRRTSGALDETAADGTASEARRVVRFAQTIVGTALVVPAVWLVVAFAASL